MEQNISQMELLKYAIESGMLNIELVQDNLKMQKRKELLEKHPYSIYQGKDGNWYSYLPDDNAGRKKIKANTEEKIIDKVVSYWSEKENNPTVESVFCEWLDKKEEYNEIEKPTVDRYKVDFHKYFVEIKDMHIKDIDDIFLEDFVKRSIATYGMSQKRFSNFRTLIYGIFKYAKKHKLIGFNITYVMQDMDISKRAFQKTIRLAEEQIFYPEEKKLVEQYLTDNPDIINLGLLLIFKTGVRVGELAAIKVEDVKNYAITICRTETRYSGSDGKAVFEVKDLPKTEAGIRFAILPNQYEWILDKILSCYRTGEYLFEKNGERVKTYTFRKRLKFICEKKLGIKSRSPHKIRKTYGTILLDGGIRESTILESMGHTDIECTKGHYYFDRTTIESKRNELSTLSEL